MSKTAMQVLIISVPDLNTWYVKTAHLHTRQNTWKRCKYIGRGSVIIVAKATAHTSSCAYFFSERSPVLISNHTFKFQWSRSNVLTWGVTKSKTYPLWKKQETFYCKGKLCFLFYNIWDRKGLELWVYSSYCTATEQNPCSDLFNAHVWIRPDRSSDYMVHSICTWLFFPAR